MNTLTLAGHETTSATLSFVLYELAQHPEYQERMRQEIRGVRAKVIARGGNGLTTEDLDSLTLSINAIKASSTQAVRMQRETHINHYSLRVGDVAIPPYRSRPPACRREGRRDSSFPTGLINHG